MFLGVDDAAKKLGVCQQTIRRMAKQGKIKYIKMSSRHYVYNVDDYIKQQTIQEKDEDRQNKP